MLSSLSSINSTSTSPSDDIVSTDCTGGKQGGGQGLICGHVSKLLSNAFINVDRDIGSHPLVLFPAAVSKKHRIKQVERMFARSDGLQASQQPWLLFFTTAIRFPLTHDAFTFDVCFTILHQQFPLPFGLSPILHSPEALVDHQDPFKVKAIWVVVEPSTLQYGVPFRLNPERTRP